MSSLRGANFSPNKQPSIEGSVHASAHSPSCLSIIAAMNLVGDPPNDLFMFATSELRRRGGALQMKQKTFHFRRPCPACFPNSPTKPPAGGMTMGRVERRWTPRVLSVGQKQL